MSNYAFSVNQCPEHGAWKICFEEGASGFRIAGSKCCGRFLEVARMNLTPAMMSSIINELECALDKAGKP
jgi:hypothetical protein